MGVAHYDAPSPDRIDYLDTMHRADLFREANELKAWVEVEDGNTGAGPDPVDETVRQRERRIVSGGAEPGLPCRLVKTRRPFRALRRKRVERSLSLR